MFDMFGLLWRVGVKRVKVIYYSLLSAAAEAWTSLSLVQVGVFFCAWPNHCWEGDGVCQLAQALKAHTYTQQIALRKRKIRAFLTEERDIDAKKVSEVEKDE